MIRRGALVALAACWVLSLLAPAGFAAEEDESDDTYDVSFPATPDFRSQYEAALDEIPKDDLSWIALRTVVGPDLWDAATRFTPDWFLKSTFPQMENDPDFSFKAVDLLKLGSIAKKEKEEGGGDERQTSTIRDVLSLGLGAGIHHIPDDPDRHCSAGRCLRCSLSCSRYSALRWARA